MIHSELKANLLSINMKLLKKYLEMFLPLVFVFLAGIFRPYDSDLGWHLKYGEYFFKFHHILTTNIYSQMMPNYKWADTDWAIDIITYFVYHYLGGFFGLSILGGLIVALTFLFFSKAFKLDYFEKAIIFPFIAYIEIPINDVSFRGQQVSVLLLGILFYIIEKFDLENKKIIYFAIPLFFFWANLNGQFVLGLGLFAFWIFVKLITLFFEKERNIFAIKKEAITLGSVFFLTILVTLINPFGFGIYNATLDHLGSKYLKDVAEYLPFKESSNMWWNQLIIGVLIGVGTLFIFFRGELKKRLPIFSILGILYLLSWTVKRYAWSFYYLAIPFLKPLVFFVKPDDKRYAFWGATILFTIYIALTLFIKSPLTQYKDMNWNTYCKELTGCSSKAADFIVKFHLNNSKLLTLYDWGGYLIWNYPQIKPTIDGRMHIWIDDKGYSAFGDYYGYEQNMKTIQSSPYNTVLISPTKPIYNELLNLRKQGKWILVYRDIDAAIFRRVSSL